MMVYFLSAGLSFDLAGETVKTLKDKEPELFVIGRGSRWMLLFEGHKRSLALMEYDRTKAITSLDEGQPVIPVWLDEIYQQLQQKLKA
ncbi:hypothetical protein [Nostoc sp. GT001]|uniref:hypothetical protein n=1 Tax=Nostoc sp. GT001 TaxID=3056647 RepID=UPI0025AAB3C1|nr:hypothetical protein [Nostoc sp. GT001]MDM9584870.1 hypothetical protein [Nostoc sp. GT001]